MIRLTVAVLLTLSACAEYGDESNTVGTPALPASFDGVEQSLQPAQEVTEMIMDEGGFTEPSKLYEVDFTSISGEDLPFRSFEGNVVLVVNTASKCGYTGQYEGLQELYDTFKDKGLIVLGVPSNDFGAQEPGSEEQVQEFCKINYGVEFPLTKKYAVSGEAPHPFYTIAQETLGDTAEPKWNFHKILVGRDGKPIAAYPSATRPADAELVSAIEAALAG